MNAHACATLMPVDVVTAAFTGSASVPSPAKPLPIKPPRPSYERRQFMVTSHERVDGAAESGALKANDEIAEASSMDPKV